MKKLIPAIVCGLLSTPVFALDYDYNFKSGQTAVFNNYFPWEMSGNCVIETHEAQVALDAELSGGNGSVNGEQLEPGSHKVVYAANGQRFYLSAEGGASVKITLTLPALDSNKPIATDHCHL